MRGYIIEFVNAAVDSFELDTFRTDFNIGPLPNWREGDVSNQRWILHLKTRSFVSKTSDVVFKMMNFAGGLRATGSSRPTAHADLPDGEAGTRRRYSSRQVGAKRNV